MNMKMLTRVTAMSGYFGLWILLPLWYGWLAPSTHFPPGMAIAFLLTPLVFPLLGIIKGTPYTYVWSAYVSLLYFMHGIGETYSEPDQRWYGSLEILFSLMWFSGAIFYSRYFPIKKTHDH
jgi:uncharacterized membrane protein